LAATHLVERGHRTIAFVGGPLAIPQVAERLAGARAVVAETPGAALELLEMPALTTTYGRRAGEAIAAMPASKRPTAVFCANDL
ncbi:substrate-binding domain-containing protein, partial [Escherichia coli]|uniref:substrate-binding domain-containing protein n=1 Tax=Escherichia coli TaxID=562 RepID=UPI0021139483